MRSTKTLIVLLVIALSVSLPVLRLRRTAPPLSMQSVAVAMAQKARERSAQR
jgi:hypothetical protein